MRRGLALAAPRTVAIATVFPDDDPGSQVVDLDDVGIFAPHFLGCAALL